MQANQLVETVEAYFAAVDRKDLSGVLSFFSVDARFTVATYDTLYEGRDTQIAGMFERLFSRYEGIWHGDFAHVVQASGLVATRFRVLNVTHDGEEIRKNNCNFFRQKDGLFDEVFVYMSGDNALR
jgi:ketosteroid isomerase-like protein